MHSCEPHERANGCARQPCMRHVTLHNFVRRHAARVLHFNADGDWLTRINLRLVYARAAIRKGRIAQPKAKWIERSPGEIAIGPLAHSIIRKSRKLRGRGVERYRQPSRWAVTSCQYISPRCAAFFPWI